MTKKEFTVFANIKIQHLEDLMNATRTLLGLNNFNKVPGYKINIKGQYTNDKVLKKTLRKISNSQLLQRKEVRRERGKNI